MAGTNRKSFYERRRHLVPAEYLPPYEWAKPWGLQASQVSNLIRSNNIVMKDGSPAFFKLGHHYWVHNRAVVR